MSLSRLRISGAKAAANPPYQTSRAANFRNKCKKKRKKHAPAMAVGGFNRDWRGGWSVQHKLHIYYKMQKGDGNSINICGGCRSSLRWAAICRLISGRYIIEIFLPSFFFSSLPSTISISWRKCSPEAAHTEMVYVYLSTVYCLSVNFESRCRLLFLFFWANGTQKVSLWASLMLHGWFVASFFFIHYLNLSLSLSPFLKWSSENKQKGANTRTHAHTHKHLWEGLRGCEV